MLRQRPRQLLIDYSVAFFLASKMITALLYCDGEVRLVMFKKERANLISKNIYKEKLIKLFRYSA